jgi:hypothetical protein
MANAAVRPAGGSCPLTPRRALSEGVHVVMAESTSIIALIVQL